MRAAGKGEGIRMSLLGENTVSPGNFLLKITQKNTLWDKPIQQKINRGNSIISLAVFFLQNEKQCAILFPTIKIHHKFTCNRKF